MKSIVGALAWAMVVGCTTEAEYAGRSASALREEATFEGRIFFEVLVPPDRSAAEFIEGERLGLWPSAAGRESDEGTWYVALLDASGVAHARDLGGTSHRLLNL